MLCTYKSLAVKYAAFNCRWYDNSARVKKLLHMIILRSQYPVRLTAGKFYIVSLETFAEVRRVYRCSLSVYMCSLRLKETLPIYNAKEINWECSQWNDWLAIGSPGFDLRYLKPLLSSLCVPALGTTQFPTHLEQKPTSPVLKQQES